MPLQDACAFDRLGKLSGNWFDVWMRESRLEETPHLTMQQVAATTLWCKAVERDHPKRAHPRRSLGLAERQQDRPLSKRSIVLDPLFAACVPISSTQEEVVSSRLASLQ